MSRKIKFSISDKNRLTLLEDASRGDYIDLTDHLEVDVTPIENAIKEAKDQIYNKMLLDYKESCENSNQLKILKSEEKFKKEIDDLKHQIEILEANKQSAIDIEVKKVENIKNNEINDIQTENLKLEAEYREKINQIQSENKQNIASLISEKDKQIQELENKIQNNQENFELRVKEKILQEIQKMNDENQKFKDSLTKEKELLSNEKLKLQLEIEREKINSKGVLQDKEKELFEKFEEEKKALNEKISSLEEQNSHLNLTKSALNVKKLGEELEKWCNNEYLDASVTSFEYASWEKDNTAIKEEGDVKGTKADYIFKVYLSSSEKNDENVICSVCCEMKNESNVSQNRKKNSDHFKKLDEDRKKKKCEYALLVSELEWDSNNDAPIRKVNDYEKMYVVRPQYMMSFLSLVYSISMKFKDTINEKHREVNKLKESNDIINEFENFKDTYLNKPLASLETKIQKLLKNCDEIQKLNESNRISMNEILTSTIETMKIKIERFDIKKIERKVKKLEAQEE